MKIQIIAEYPCSITSTVEMKEGKTWDDVAIWYVKWGELVLTYRDGTKEVLSVADAPSDTDYKRPMFVEVLELDEDENQTGVELDEMRD